ncbi:DUF448 domain-containing protein [Pseudodesulfovibrio sp. F-1]|uniref:DUF448 domain-containing protein n=2 Tax=Pseudodesulfovibrio alkaliphilus TaxID=2661613 RepID=A0A7K1KIZ3_9BACT|nr:DUF448 domain-containing protein [Pseudodesulfovibrio alkaliphilus]MUM76058.1 DUF448 domain-containing protein [Pseudodesulfovibrio alkaliphilus]
MMNAGHQPVRMCVVCRQRFPKEELTRYVRPADREMPETDDPVSDPEQIKPGRGFYVCVQARCRELFPKVFKGLMKKRKGESR